VLQLYEAERAHLFQLADAASGTSRRPTRRASNRWTAQPSLQWALAAITLGPAFVRNGRMDLLAANQLARAFYADVYADARCPPNLARFTFLDPNGRAFHPDWNQAAEVCVAIQALRLLASWAAPEETAAHDELATDRHEL
jgi:hypothetical protein